MGNEVEAGVLAEKGEHFQCDCFTIPVLYLVCRCYKASSLRFFVTSTVGAAFSALLAS